MTIRKERRLRKALEAHTIYPKSITMATTLVAGSTLSRP